MKLTGTSYYQAFVARDARFDGVFFVGVASTGIYCRPICPAKTPKESNCRFFASAEMAEKEFFRPCLRCRPELAPGNAPVDDARRIAQMIARRIAEDQFGENAGLEAIADQFELSSRQIRRIMKKELGVSPMELIQTRRLLLAKQLLTETQLPVTEIAFASGFSSLRRFNDALGVRYGMAPRHLRRKATGGNAAATATQGTSTVRLGYRPPYDWEGMLGFLGARTLDGAEMADEDAYRRTVQLGRHKGWICVRHLPKENALSLEFTHSLAPALPALLGRIRHLFDLSARPDLIAAHLMKDRRLKPIVAKNPGLRVPGACDGFELGVRAILGQQVSVKAARTLASRFVEAFGERIETPFPGLQRLAPRPENIALEAADRIARLGIASARAKCIVALAQAFASGEITLEEGAPPEMAIRRLMAVPGIGSWTAHYLAMRGLRWPDAFPKEDLALRNSLGGLTAAQAEEASQAWRPWRSYAVLHLWRNPAPGGKKE